MDWLFPITERFCLTEAFLDKYSGKQPPWGPLGYVTYKRTYARVMKNGKTEEWFDTVKRVVEGTYTTQLNHCKRFRLPWNAYKSQKSAQEMYRLIWEFKFLPPGRGLWMMGTDYIWQRTSAPLQNCAFVSTEHIGVEYADPFTFLMDMSMLGVGVAFDTKGAGKLNIINPEKTDEIFTPEDSKEGWTSVVERILLAFLGRGTLPLFDYSNIRPAGSPIKSFGGIAPGPDPLRACEKALTIILLENADKPISSVLIVDVMNIIAKCVVSGGVRRSASLALGSSEDTEYMSMKDPKAQHLDDWRWASNNSITAEVGMDYTDIVAQLSKNGEPGLVWIDNAQHYGRIRDGYGAHDLRVQGTNPCGEQSLESYEICNLVETFPSRHDTYEEYANTLKFAYLYAKTVTLITTHNERTNQIVWRNRRIGLSQSGIIESFNKHGRREHFRWCENGYQYIKKLDDQYSSWLGIPKSIKMTSVKPSGTVSLLPGVSPGIHYDHAEYYYRTIRVDKSSTLIAPLQRAGYRMEESLCGDGTLVVYFPVHISNFDCKKDGVSVWEQLENAAQMQYYWSDNQVSVTITFKKEEESDIPKALALYETRLKAVSFLPLRDHEYKQAPYQEITEEEYTEAMKQLKPLSLRKAKHEVTDKFCDGESCVV